jgi:ribose/xylose/arabinose/galactoside ABC-type transport system permease subunit
LTIGVLNNVLGLRGVDPNLQRVLKGAIIVAAVLIQRERRSR